MFKAGTGRTAVTAGTLILDYGLGNIKSLSEALKFTGHDVTVSDNPGDIRTANRLILPGVGSFPSAMRMLQDRNLVSGIVGAAQSGVPLLGVCLGMQLLFEVSHEQGMTQGLSLLAGHVKPIWEEPDPSPRRTHIGWRILETNPDNKSNFLNSSDVGPFYFVHSFSAIPKSHFVEKAKVTFGARDITSVVEHENIIGMQFHPEKSRSSGLDLLSRFRTF